MKHLKLATQSGGTDKVKNATTSTGINDAASLSVVKLLLETGKTLRKRTAGQPVMPESQVLKELTDELERQLLREPINPLIGMAGRICSPLY
jgi:hypothetical protein